jgi:CO dehydrogenase/acetyl-CoA synthase alpha subunit
MKKVLAIFAFAAMSAMAAEVTGYIVDQNCASKQGAKAASDDHSGCAESCIKRGTPAVLVTADGKIYKIAEQDKVTAHAGHKVTITGKVDGETISVDSVKM